MAQLTLWPITARPPLRVGEPLLWLTELSSPRDSISAHALCRTILANYLGCEAGDVRLQFPRNQAPVLDAQWLGFPLSVSLSYAGKMLLLGLVAGQKIGVDVMQEFESCDAIDVARLYLGPTVAAQLAGLSPPHRAASFAQHWTALEARYKSYGLPLQEFPGPVFIQKASVRSVRSGQFCVACAMN